MADAPGLSFDRDGCSLFEAALTSDAPRRRRVLQVDYAAADLDGGLRWRGLS